MSHKNKPRTYARNRLFSRKGNEASYESDGTYVLKLVLVLLLGMLWLRFTEPLVLGGAVLTGIPLGLILGGLFVSKFEHFQYDRKIWYAILVVATLISYFLPAGIVI